MVTASLFPDVVLELCGFVSFSVRSALARAVPCLGCLTSAFTAPSGCVGIVRGGSGCFNVPALSFGIVCAMVAGGFVGLDGIG